MAKTSQQSMTVYVRHRASDGELAQWVAEGLAGAGVVPQLDEIGITAGDNVVSWLDDAIGESDHVLVLLGPKPAEEVAVEAEWLDALMKEGYLRRAFIVPVLLPGLDDAQVPEILPRALCEDFRGEHPEKSLMHLIARLRDDLLIKRELGRRPTPATRSMVEHLATRFHGDEGQRDVVVHSNRFKRCFRLRVAGAATGHYLVEMLRDTLHLKFADIDDDLGIELSYGYFLKHEGEPMHLEQTLDKSGVRNGDRLELWIRVTVRDLLEDKAVGEEVFRRIYGQTVEALSDEQLTARRRALSSAEIARIASGYFAHVDE